MTGRQWLPRRIGGTYGRQTEPPVSVRTWCYIDKDRQVGNSLGVAGAAADGQSFRGGASSRRKCSGLVD